MKYLIFLAVCAGGVPAMAFAATLDRRVRGLLLSALIFSTALGVRASINFMSMEDYRGPDRGFEVTLTDLIALSLVAAMTLRFPAKVSWLPYNTFVMAFFWCMACISVWVAPAHNVALFTLFKLLRLYVVYWCVLNCMRTDVHRNFVWGGFVAVGLYVTALCFQQKYLGGLYRTPGPFDHSNTVPIYLNMIMPVLLLWGLCDRSFKPWQSAISVVAALGMVFSVVSTQSRAGLAIAALSVLALFAFANWRARSLRVSLTSVVLLVVFSIGALLAADTALERFRNAPEASEAARDEFNVAAAMMAQDHFFGVGLNNFSKVLTAESRYNSHITVMKNEKEAGVAHHIYWLTAAEMGYAALLLYITIAARFAWRAWRGTWRSRELESLLLFGFFLGACATHLTGFFEWALRITPASYMFVITSALIVAFDRRAA